MTSEIRPKMRTRTETASVTAPLRAKESRQNDFRRSSTITFSFFADWENILVISCLHGPRSGPKPATEGLHAHATYLSKLPGPRWTGAGASGVILYFRAR